MGVLVADALSELAAGSLEHALLHDPTLRLGFTTPEKLVLSPALEAALAHAPRLTHIVIDEVHLLLDWDEFRALLARLRSVLERVRKRRRSAGLLRVLSSCWRVIDLEKSSHAASPACGRPGCTITSQLLAPCCSCVSTAVTSSSGE